MSLATVPEENSDERAIRRLIQAAREDEVQLGPLLQRHAHYLRWIARACVDTRLRKRVSESDIVQDTYANAVRGFGDFRGTSPAEFSVWLRQILINCVRRQVERHLLTAGRDARREISMQDLMRRADDSVMALSQALEDRERSPASQVASRERARIVIDVIESLPPDRRDCLKLRHVEGLSFREIAERLGCSEAAARMRYMRAIDSTRRRMPGGQP